MPYTANSDWRKLGDITPDQMRADMQKFNSPMLAELDAIYAAVKGMSALYSGHAYMEDKWGSMGVATQGGYNALGNMQPGSDHVPMVFKSWADGAAWWKAHVLDPKGPYAKAKTLKQYVHIYAPASDGNNEGEYVDTILRYANMGADPQPAPAPAPTPCPTPTTTTTTTPPPVPGPPTRGHVPMPPYIARFDVGNTHHIGAGRSADADRAGHILGSCVHTSEGYFTGNLNSFSNPDWGGLTDAQVGGPWDGQDDGVLMLFIDPQSRVVPWANGGIETDAPASPMATAYMAAYGRTDYAVNGRLRSIETTDGGNADVTKGGRQIETLCHYLAHVHSEEAGQTADTFTYDFQHRNFGGAHQQCPGAWIEAHWGEIEARTKAIIRAYQTGTPLSPPLTITYPPGYAGPPIPQPGAGPTPPPTPPAPAPGPTYAPKHPLPPGTTPLVVGSVTYWPYRATVTATKDAPCWEWADPQTSAQCDAPIRQGQKAQVAWITVGDDGALWFVGPNGARLQAADFTVS